MADDATWVEVLPSMRNFGPQLIKGATAAAGVAGASAGRSYASSFSKSADVDTLKSVVSKIAAWHPFRLADRTDLKLIVAYPYRVHEILRDKPSKM